jgi:serine/threonine-protein kinase
MSPEQCHGKKVDHRADIYALGVVIHEMLTGRPLFQADSSLDLFVKHTTASPEPMSSVCADVPPALDAPVLAMLAKRPENRPASAGKAVAALADRARAAGATAAHAPTMAGAPLATPPDAEDERALARIEAATVREVKSPPAAEIPSAAPVSSSARDSGARPSVAATPPAQAALAPRPRPSWLLTAATGAAVVLSALALAQSGAGRGTPAAVSSPGRAPAEAASSTAPAPPTPPPVVAPAPTASATASGSAGPASASPPAPSSSARPRPAAGPAKPVLHGDLERPSEYGSR